MTVLDSVIPDQRTVDLSVVRPTAGRWESRYVRVALAADVAAASLAGGVAYVGRFAADGWPRNYLALSLMMPLVWALSLAAARLYDVRLLGVGSEEFRRILAVAGYLLGAVALLAYFSATEVSRGYVIIALPMLLGMTVTGRFALRKRLHRRRATGACMHRVIAVGHGAGVLDMARRLRRERFQGFEVVGACLPTPGQDPQLLAEGVGVFGDFDDVRHAVELSGADTVAVLSSPEMSGAELRRLAWSLESTGTDLVVAPGLVEVAGPRLTIRPVDGLPLLHVERPMLRGARRVVKEAFDRVLATSSLLLLAPLMLALVVTVRATSTGPALFRQTRIGVDGRPFTCLKFRTMVVDAEQRKLDLLELNERKEGLLFKVRDDPRITPLGRLLRRYSLDELPQLVNVALGQMSLVGPRPPLPDEVERYGDDVRRRLLVRPGLTGLWQVSGRSDLTWEESVRLDLRYVDNWSLALDLLILWKTGRAVLRGSGAY